MKHLKFAILAIALIVSNLIFAQLKTPQPSPTCTVSQVVGLTDIEVSYSRPGKKDRIIFGNLVPFGEMWRLGANASTKLKTSDDIMLAGMKVPAGEYALYVIPRQKDWTIVVHKDLSLWGIGGYDVENDLLRFNVPALKTADTYETLTIDFSDLSSDGTQMYIVWENTKVEIPVKTQAIQQVEAQIQKEIIDGPGAGEYAGAARFYIDQEKDMGMALEWIDKAIEKRPDAFWYVHNRAQILGKLGRKKEALAAAEKSITMAKADEDGDYGYIKRNEDLMMELNGKSPAKVEPKK